MRRLQVYIVLVLFSFLAGCESHPLTDYRPAVQAGIFSGTIEDLKKLNASDTEIAEVIQLKKAGISEDTILALVRIAHEHQHPFTATGSVKSLAGANFTEPRILQIAQTDQIDAIGGDAVMLRVIGLSDPTVQLLLDRRLKGIPTMSVGTIADLKNTGLTEKDILYRIQQGMTDAQGEAEANARHKALVHSNTGFKRIVGSKRR
ncbi:MAG TPA: hypothetical protein VN025_15640 [Candidatus Dormibacteraeota bacterium]|jgi:hypothetical protein|nr:hypothetical protein [Candidatus Dormibacteraeota bacterium]